MYTLIISGPKDIPSTTSGPSPYPKDKGIGRSAFTNGEFFKKYFIIIQKCYNFSFQYSLYREISSFGQHS